MAEGLEQRNPRNIVRRILSSKLGATAELATGLAVMVGGVFTGPASPFFIFGGLAAAFDGLRRLGPEKEGAEEETLFQRLKDYFAGERTSSH